MKDEDEDEDEDEEMDEEVSSYCILPLISSNPQLLILLFVYQALFLKAALRQEAELEVRCFFLSVHIELVVFHWLFKSCSFRVISAKWLKTKTVQRAKL